MITYKRDRNRHIFSMNNADLADLGELIWLLKHTPPPIGYNRKPFTLAQQRVIDGIYSAYVFPPDFATTVNAKTGQ